MGRLDLERHQQRRRRAHGGKLIWLVAKATGDLADAIDRDLFTDGRDFDDLGWRGLWAYITTAPPGTAIHYHLTEGWPKEAKIAAETLYGLRVLLWRYRAVHFVGGADADFPEPIDYPGRESQSDPQKSWETVTLDEMVSPEVRAFLKGA